MHAVLCWLAVLISAAVTNVCCHIFTQGVTSQPVNSEEVPGSLWHSRSNSLAFSLLAMNTTAADFISAQLGESEMDPKCLTVSRLALCSQVLSVS